jgi:hypothetical protein
MTLERLAHGQHNPPGLIFRATSMTAEIEDSVVISDGQSGVILTPAGAPSLGFPRFDMDSGRFIW